MHAVAEAESFEDFYRNVQKGKVISTAVKHWALHVLIFAVSFGISLLLPGIPQMVVVILSITTLAIIGIIYQLA